MYNMKLRRLRGLPKLSIRSLIIFFLPFSPPFISLGSINLEDDRCQLASIC